MRKMKDSGIEWIGEIPEDWEITRLKNILNERKESNNPIKTNFILSLTASNGVIPYTEKKSSGNKAKEDLSAYKLAYPGDIVLNNMNVVAGSVGLSEYFGCVSPVYYMLYPRNKYDNVKYFNYVFQSSVFQKSLIGLGNGIMMKESQNGKLNTIRMRISMDKLNTVLLPLPNSHIQKLIADYLDDKVREIDNIISKTQETIEEYKKYKQSVITEAVTKGLNPNVEMKDSRIEWIGEIPKDWNVRKIKWIMRNKSIKNHPNEEVLSLYREYGIVPKDSRNDNHNVTSENTETYKFVEINDFVINKMKAWQGSMAVSNYRGIVSPAYYVCEIYDNNIYNKYLHYLLRNQLYIPEFRRLSTGMRVGQWDLNINDFMNIEIIIPKLDEQKKIAEYLDKKCLEIDNLITKKQELISQLEQYKKSIIYEYVTGKKEVAVAYGY